MAIQIAEPLNNLPVKTYRWLKVNDLQLGEEIKVQKKPYQKEFLPTVDIEGVVLRKITDDTVSAAHHGVSEELVKIAETANNAGILLHVPSGITVPHPIVIRYSMDGGNDVLIDRNIITADEGSRAIVVFDYSTESNEYAFHNAVTTIHAQPNSHITIVKVQRMNDQSHHFDSIIADIEPYARVDYVQVELGSKISVTNYVNNLGDSAEAHIDTVYLGDGERVLDLSYLMNHLGRRSLSKIQANGALKDSSKKIFRGTIDFKRGASQADGGEEEYVLLLDKGVKSDAVPLLLCAEDDVKGQHAASAGKIDDDKLYYMMSRGFSKTEAVKLMVEASFRPAIDKLPLPELQAAVNREIHRRVVSEKF